MLFRLRGERGKGKEVRSLLYGNQCQVTGKGAGVQLVFYQQEAVLLQDPDDLPDFKDF